MIRPVIFDMDGLIIDSEPLWRKAHIEVLKTYGITVTNQDVQALDGMRTDDQVAMWQKQFNGSLPSLKQVSDEITEYAMKFIRANGRALPGVVESIQLLSELRIPMAIASSSSSDIIRVVLEKLQIDRYIQVAHSAEDEQRGKPFPDVFLSTAILMNVEPSQCLVLEDSQNGVNAAKAAGMKCIAIPQLPYDARDFHRADLVVDSVEYIRWDEVLAL